MCFPSDIQFLKITKPINRANCQISRPIFILLFDHHHHHHRVSKRENSVILRVLYLNSYITYHDYYEINIDMRVYCIALY